MLEKRRFWSQRVHMFKRNITVVVLV